MYTIRMEEIRATSTEKSDRVVKEINSIHIAGSLAVVTRAENGSESNSGNYFCNELKPEKGGLSCSG